MLIELNCFLGGMHTAFDVARPRAFSFLPAVGYRPTRSGGAKETMLIKRRDNRLFSQTTPGPFQRPGRFASDFGRGTRNLVNSFREDNPAAGRTWHVRAHDSLSRES